ncbi:T9SS type A sorting domain-containing protein [Wenyingzhuangia sp. IMCC45467]
MKTTLHKKMATLGVTLLTIGAVHAQTTATWTGATDTDFLTATNWDTGVVPNDANGVNVIINDVANDPVLSSDLPDRDVRLIDLNDGASLTISAQIWAETTSTFAGTLTLNGSADFNIRNRAYFGDGGDSVLNIDGGRINSKSYFRIGNGSYNTIVNVNGGDLDSENTLFVGRYTGDGFTAVINLNSGNIEIDGLSFYSGDQHNKGKIIIDGGSLIINGDYITEVYEEGVKTNITIADFVTDGNIEAVSGKTISASYDAGTDKTTVTATPSLSFNNNASKVTTNVYVQGTTVFVSNVSTQTAVNVYSITGALVKSISTNTDTQFSLTSGVWIATVKTEEGQKSVKIVCN